jgi:hypothetical protein
MQVYWKTLMLKIVGWIIAEVILNFAGLDNLANYSEFIYKPYLLCSQTCETSIAIALN